MARKGKRRGDEILFQCPHSERHNNGDANPSARFSTSKHTWFCDPCRIGGGWVELCSLIGLERPTAGAEKSYQYTDSNGSLVFEVVRKPSKKFPQRRPDGNGGWIWNMRGVKRVPYRLPALIAAVASGKRIFVVEGEKDADNLERLGLVATTNPGGAGKWRPSYSEHLAGAQVAILPDNDEPGRQHGEAVAASLSGTTSEVRIVELPDLPAGGDVSDWIAAQAADTDIAEALESHVGAAPIWKSMAPPRATHTEISQGHPYRETKQGLVYEKPGRDGVTDVALTNFAARIVAEVIRDDGAESRPPDLPLLTS